MLVLEVLEVLQLLQLLSTALAPAPGLVLGLPVDLAELALTVCRC